MLTKRSGLAEGVPEAADVEFGGKGFGFRVLGFRVEGFGFGGYG